MRYRPEIDGLRAIAVISVILFHTGIPLFEGGYIGVDVFFVISGYLITAIIMKDIHLGKFSLISFYKRRARRILPVLFLILIISIPLSFIYLWPYELKKFFQSMASTLVFSSNIFFWYESGYWSPSAKLIPLLHTWSLAIEEQFYIVFPPFILILTKFKKKWLTTCLILTGIISIVIAQWGAYNKPSATFYLLPTRAWELIIGAIIALEIQKTIHFKKTILNEVLSFLGFFIVFTGIFFFRKETPFPGFYGLLPTLGTALIIIYSSKKTIVYKVLSSKVLVSIGLISYSAYLWHQPLFSFARHQSFLSELDTYNYIILVFLTFMLAFFSWEYIEKPFRKKEFKCIKKLFSVFIILIVIGLLGNITNGFENIWLSIQSEKTRNTYKIIAKIDNGNKLKTTNTCRFRVVNITPASIRKIKNCYKKNGKGYVILGDSHATDLFNSIISTHAYPFIVGFTNGGCPLSNFIGCNYKEKIKFIKNNKIMFLGVVYEQAGFYLLKSENKKNSRSMFKSKGYEEAVKGIYIDEKLVKLTYKKLKKLSDTVKVIWFGSRIEPHISKKTIIIKGCDFEFKLRKNQRAIFEQLDKYIYNIVSIQKSLYFISQNEVYNYHFPEDFMSCNGTYWSDGDHLSVLGEKTFGKRFDLFSLFSR